ncbi:uncharacterized protein CG3556-like [Rhynchophorus ferrugineus]|uniref:uncharacterized protein CG3556-like n=1 Tax=Rhynchophorus ferrugineus TaxID=354439 RepID=UPI003FCE9896
MQVLCMHVKMKSFLLIFFVVTLFQFVVPTYTAADKAEEPSATISYTLWLNPDITKQESLNITAPNGTSFYEVMQLAASLNPNFAFQAREYPGMGHYIFKLAGQEEDFVNNIYWMIFKLTDLPDPTNPPSDDFLTPVGVDSIFINDKDIYLFWYKYVIFE